MDQDFEIEIIAPDGFDRLEPNLGLCPIELDVGEQSSGDIVLVQTKVSPVAGFGFLSRSNDKYSFLLTLTNLDCESTGTLVTESSKFLELNKMAHKIVKIDHETGFDEEQSSYDWV